jgi:RNA polymerase sigma factor (TIGR02999 family)
VISSKCRELNAEFQGAAWKLAATTPITAFKRQSAIELSEPTCQTCVDVSELTQILRSIQEGVPQAADALLPLVYDELRRLAAAKMARELPGQTLQPTALVHEAWLRLGGDEQPRWQNSAHFLGAAAEAMRRILVENARRKLCLKRGGGQEKVELCEAAIEAPVEDEKILQVHEALDALEAEDPRKAQIVKLRFFAGLGHEEIAALLGVNEKTVRRHWEIAKVRLFQRIKAAP